MVRRQEMTCFFKDCSQLSEAPVAWETCWLQSQVLSFHSNWKGGESGKGGVGFHVQAQGSLMQTVAKKQTMAQHVPGKMLETRSDCQVCRLSEIGRTWQLEM